MEKLTNEIDLLISNDKQVILTSHRIRQENKSWGSIELKSIMLEHVTSCEYVKKSLPLLLILSLISIVFAVGAATASDYEIKEFYLISGFALAIVLLILYFLSIKKVLVIASPSIKIIMNTSKMKVENIKSFIDKLEGAKNKLNYK